MSTKEEQNNAIIERAKSAILARDYEQAVRIYKGLLTTEPDNLEYLKSLGDLYVKIGDDKVAGDYYNEIVKIQPQNIDALNNLGAIYRRLKLYDESISVLERVVLIDPSNVQAYYNLGFTYKIMGSHDDAIQCFNTVVEENPRDVLAFNHIGTIYAAQKKHAEAVNSYFRGLKVDPNHPILHLNLAKSFEKMGDFVKAQNEYEAALKSKPGWIEAIESYSDLLVRKNKTKNATEIVKKALVLNPKDSAMHTKLGDVYRCQENFEDAETEYNTALSITPDYVKALSGLANSYEITGRMDEALEIADRLEVIEPEDPSVKRQHAHILLSADKIERAGEKIQELYNRDPDDVHTLNLLGQYYICAGDEKKASGCFKKIKALRPEYTSFYREAGKRHTQKGDFKKAEEFYQKYISQNPEDTDGYKSMAKNYEAQGMLTQALESYRALENCDPSNHASKKGLERVNRQILEEREKKQEERTVFDANEFFDSDDDISIEGRVRVSEEVKLSFEDMNHPEKTEFSKEDVPDEKEFEMSDYPESFEELQVNEISTDEIFREGRLDEEIMADNQDHYSKSLDDLIGDVDLDEEGSGLEEDDTSAEDFFANNSLGNSPNSSAAKENNLEPDFEFVDEPDGFEAESAKDDVISLDEGWEDETEEEPEPEKPVRRPNSRPQPRPMPKDERQPEFLPEVDEDDFAEPESNVAEPMFEPEVEPVVEPTVEEEVPEESFEDMESEEFVPDEEPLEEESLEDEVEPDAFLEEDLTDSADDFEIGEEEQECEEDILPEEDLDSVEESIDEGTVDLAILEEAADTIQTMADAIKENKAMKTANVNADLFEKLRSLSTYLPEDKRKEFLESKIRLQLDYIISKLSGKRGLLGTAIIFRNQIGKEDEATELDSGRTLLIKVLEYSKGLVRGLPDATMVSSLNWQLEDLLSRV